METKYTHYTNFGASQQPEEADQDGFLEYRTGFEGMDEDDQTPAERWIVAMDAQIACWRNEQ